MSSDDNIKSRRYSTPFHNMTVDILENVLRNAENIELLGDYLSYQMRELTGAKTVILVQYLHSSEGITQRIISVNPERRIELAQSVEIIRLINLLHDQDKINTWGQPGDISEEANILSDLKCGISISIPINVGIAKEGILLLLDIPVTRRLPLVLEALDMLSTVIALVFRNSLLYEEQESIIRERTKELNIINEKLLLELTERKLAEQKINAQAKALDTIFNSAPNIMILVNSEGKVEKINQKGTDFTGRRENDLIGLSGGNAINCLNSFSGKGCGFSEACTNCPVRSRIDDTLQTGVPHHDEEGTMSFLINGNEITHNLLISTRLIESDNNKQVLVSLTNITRIKETEAQLQQAQKMEGIGTLAGGIAHDFNNILSPIILYSELAMNDLAPDNPLQKSMKEIYKAGDRARNLVKQILTFARKRSEEKALLKASLIVKEATQFLRSTIPTTINIEYDNKAEQDTVLADPTQLNQIVMNLCTNAAYAMRENGGLLEVVLHNEAIPVKKPNALFRLKPGPYLRLSVTDTGTGIPPDALNRIFEPYYTTKQPGEGTGLGLAIIHGIVNNYGGDIIVESEVGKGSTFHVYIPLAEKQTSNLEKKKTECPQGHEHILFVDDEKAVAIVNQKILEKLGYQVTARTSSIEALETFINNQEAFDLVVTDMTMPDMTGKQLASEMRSLRPDIPIILCTGFSDQIDEKEAVKMGIDAFMIKPIVMSEMANTIRDVLEKRRRALKRKIDFL